MPLSADSKLGPYEVLAPIGTGGMGEVYKARDPRLDRTVAIKVSRAEFTERFNREARLVAQLNHQNICHLYDVGPNYLVMELIEGETLAERIAQGAVAIIEALAIARQIADALEAAHEKGIIHRDLKPANIKLTAEGAVKVLDFGLARLAAPESADPHDSPTTLASPTQVGTILGTAAYMSPEQAAGKPVDKRADIWSFGVVLWEMLTGKQLFRGETLTHTLADVLRAPIDFDRVPGQMPAPIRRLLRRCLERDARKRLRDIGEARIAIDEALSEPGQDRPEATPDAVAKRAIVPWAVAAISILAFAFLAFVHLRETPPRSRVIRTTLLPPEGTTFAFDVDPAQPAVSPDGSWIVFGPKPNRGPTQLWVRRLDSSEAQALPGTERAEFPFWSPEGRWIAFGQGLTLKKIDIQGGPPVQIATLTGPFMGGAWNREGVIVFGAVAVGPGQGLFRVSAAGGTPVQATAMEAGEWGSHAFPSFLPDGRHFLYIDRQDGTIPVRVGSLDEPGKSGKKVAQASSNAIYANGYLLYVRDTTLIAQPFDLRSLQTAGEGMLLAEGIPSYVQPSRHAVFSVSNGGLLVYQSGNSAGVGRLVWKDREGKVQGALGEFTGKADTVMLSPDGRKLAARIADARSNLDIWIYDTARGIPTRFTFDPAQERDPVWSPDGNMLYFSSDRGGHFDIFRKPVNAGSAEELLFSDGVLKRPETVSPDGKLLLFNRVDPKTGSDLWVLPLTPAGVKTQPYVFLASPFNERLAQFSPDGHWVAYQSDKSGQYEVYVTAFPGPGGERQITSGGAFLPRWRRDGKELFFSGSNRAAMAAQIAIGNGTLEIGTVRKLFDGVVARGNYDVTGDGQRFVGIEGSEAASTPLTLLENWPATLR